MKNAKMILSACVVFAIVGSALAFKPVQFATVYCGKNGNTCTSKILFRVASTTTQITDPCENGAGKEYLQTTSTQCDEITALTQFEAVEP